MFKKFSLLVVAIVLTTSGVAFANDDLAGLDLKSITDSNDAVIEAGLNVDVDALANKVQKDDAVEACFRRCGYYGGHCGYSSCYNNCYSSCYNNCYSSCYSNCCHNSCYTPCYTPCYNSCSYTCYEPTYYVAYRPVTYTTYSTSYCCQPSCQYWGCSY